MAKNPFDVQINIDFNEAQAGEALDKALKRLKDGYKLKLSLDIDGLDKIAQQLKGVSKEATQTFNLDTTKATDSIREINKEMDRIDKKQFRFTDDEQVEYIENVRKNLIETQKVVENLNSNKTKTTITEDYKKAYDELAKLQKQEFSIKEKMIGKNKEQTTELQKQLDIVKQYQNDIGKTINKYNIPNKESFNNDLLKARNIEQSKLNIKQNEYNQSLKEETMEVKRQIENYQKEKMAKVEVFKSRYKGLYDKDAVSGLEKSINNIKADNLKEVRSQFQGINAEFKKVEANAKSSANAIKSTQKDAISVSEMLGNSLKKFNLWLMVGNISVKMINVFKKGIKYSYDFNKALTEISVVTNQSQQRVERLADSYGRLSKEMSTLKEETIASTVEFYRQGLSQQEVLERVVTTTKFAKISNLDTRESAELLTATVNSMGKDIENVSDVFIILGDSTATSSEELSKGFQKVGGVAGAMNVEFEKASSWLATISARTRESAESIGTGLKTIMARYQQLTEKGYVEEDGTKVNNVAKALNEAGIKMIDATGQFKNFGDVMDELGGKWDKLDNRTKAYIANAMAGTYQLSRFTNLMEGYSDSIDLYETALNSAGTTQKKYNLWLEGTEASFNRVKGELTDIWTKLFESKHLKNMLGIVEDILKTVNFLIDKMGSVPFVLMTSIGILSLLNDKIKTQVVGKYFKFLNDNIIGFNKQLVITKEKVNGITRYTQKTKDVFSIFGSSFNGGAITKFLDIISMKLMNLQMRIGLASVAFKKAKAESGMFSGALAFLGIAIDTTTIKTRLMSIAMKGAKIAVIGLQAVMTVGLSIVFTKVMEWIDNTIHKTQRLKESIEELESNVKNNIESNARNIQTLLGLGDEYNELTNKLSSGTALTTEEQKRLYEIQNEIANISPEVVTGYDEQGNAIINLTGGVEGLIETLKEKNRIEQLSLVASWSDKQSLLEKDIDKENKKINKLTKERENALKQIEKLNEKAKSDKGINKGSSNSLEKWKNKLSEINAEIEKSRLEIKNINTQALSTSSAMLNVTEGYDKLDNGIKKIISSLMKAKGIDIKQSDAEKFVKMFSDKRVADTIKQINNLKANPNSVKDFNTELEKTVKTLAKLIEEISDGKIKLDTKEILSAFNLKKIEDSANSIKEQIKDFKDARDDLKEYAGYIKELNEQGYLSADSMSQIIEKHEELIPYLLDEGNLYDKLIELQNKEKDNAVKAILEKLKTNEMFFKSILKKNPELVNELKKAYDKDLENFKTVSDAKKNINNLLIQTMGNQWSILYGTDIEALETFISDYERVQENLKNGNLSKRLLDTKTYSKENYDKAKASLNLAKEIKRITDEAKDKLNKYNLGLDENTKATNKAKYATDAYANAMKALKTQLSELNSSMSKLYKNSWDYVKSLDKKRDLIKEQIKLTEQEIKNNEQLANSYKNIKSAKTSATSTNYNNTSLDKGLQGVLKGHGQDFIRAGNKYGIDPYLLASISMFESGRGTSSAIRNHNNPSGIMDWENNWRTIRHFNSLAEGIDFAAKNLKNLYFNQGLTTIDQIGSKYAPIGASNDPNNLNKNWIPNVKSIYRELTGGSYSSGDVSPEEAIDRAWNKAQDLKQNLIQLRDELDKLKFEKYTATIGILDDKIKRTNVNAEIYKDRAEKWSTNLVDNFKNFDNYIAEIEERNKVLLEKQKYIQNEIWYGGYNSDQLVKMRFELQDTVGEIEKMTKALQDAFKTKWEFKFQYDDRYFKEFDDEIDKIQDRIDLLNEKDILYEKGKSKLLSRKISEQEKYIIYIQRARVELLAERDLLKQNTWEWNFLNNQAKEYDDKMREIAKSMMQNKEELKNTLNTELDNLKSMEQKIIEIIKKRYETELEEYKKMNDEKKKSEEDRHKSVMDKLNEEKKAREEIIKLKLKEIDRDEEQNDYEKQLNKLIDEKLKLQYQYNSWSLVDTVEGRAKKESLREQIDKKQEEIDDYRHKRGIDLRKQNLNDSLEDIAKEYEEKNKAENKKYEDTKERLDKELKDTEEHYKKLMQKENLYAEARKTIFRNQIKYINGEMMNLTDAILRYEDEWGEGLSILGTKIKSDLIDNLQKAIDTAKNLDSILSKIKEIEKPNMNRNNIPNHTGGIVYAQSDSNSKLNDYISAKTHLEELGFKVVDITKMTKEELEKIKLTAKDLVIGNALDGHNLNGAKRIQGKDRYDTDSQIGDYAYREKQIYKNDDKSERIVYASSDENKNINDWLSAKRRFEELGFKVVDVSKMTKDAQESINVTKNDVILGEALIDRTDTSKANRLQGKDRFETDKLIKEFIKYEEDRRVGLSNDNKNVVYAQSDSNIKINDYLIAERWLSSLGYKIVDITKLTKEQLEEIKVKKGDLVIGNALEDKYVPSTQRIAGDRREETNDMVKAFAEYKDKELHGDIKDIRNIVYGWGTDLQNAQKWLSPMGYKFVNSKDLTPDELASMLRKGDIVLGEIGVNPISDDILRSIGAVRLGGITRQETLERIMSWARHGGIPQFSEGGIMDYTGLAMVHGSNSNTEVAFNSSQAKKLYNMVKDLPSGGIENITPKINSNMLKSLARISMAQHQGIIKIDKLVNIEGNADKDIIPQIERVAKTSALKELRKACNKKGIYK